MGKQKQKKGPSKKEPKRSHHDLPFKQGREDFTYRGGYKVPKADYKFRENES